MQLVRSFLELKLKNMREAKGITDYFYTMVPFINYGSEKAAENYRNHSTFKSSYAIDSRYACNSYNVVMDVHKSC